MKVVLLFIEKHVRDQNLPPLESGSFATLRLG